MVNWKQTPSQIADCLSSSKVVPLKSSPKIPAKGTLTPLSTFCLPPDEFDWFARDRLGHIVSMLEGCELFSIVGMSQYGPKIKELYLNARRKEYWACPPDMMEITADVLLQLTGLTTIVLRGMCDGMHIYLSEKK